MKKYFWFVPILLIAIGCAQMVSPTGGKKDITPPELVESNPPHKTTNFKGTTISLTFDEYVVIDNLMQKLIITPEADNPYTPTVKNQTVVLKFRKPFKDSTTYTFNFADGIKDQAERNPAQNLKLVFSTGPVIDSGRVYGTVKDIRTDKPVFDALVGLYQLSDSLTPEKNKPYYFSRTDSSGRFAIENTQIASYALIALTDKNNNLIYNPKDESIAFLDSIVNITSDSVTVEMKVFHSDITPPRVQRTIPKVNDYTLVLSKGFETLEVAFQGDKKIPYILESHNQIKFFNVPVQEDTVRASIRMVDSLGIELEWEQKINFLPQRGKERQRTPFTAKNDLPSDQPVTSDYKTKIIFNKPVFYFDSTLVKVTADSLPLPSDIRYTWNSQRNELDIAFQHKAKDSVVLTAPKGTFISIEEDTLAGIKYKNAILDPEKFGILRGTIHNPNDVPFVVELIDKDFKNLVFRSEKTPFEFRNIKPGAYRLRIFIDYNRNGRWDTGNYTRKLQPEPVIVYPQELLIKANFEYEDQYFDLSTFQAQ